MKPVHTKDENAHDLQSVMAVCCGNPKGDELPQVAGLNDILMDVYSDILNMPRDYAASRFHHQYEDDLEYEVGIIH